MAKVIGEKNSAVGSDANPVRTSKEPPSPRPQKGAVGSEHHDGVVATVEDINIVVRVHSHGSRFEPVAIIGDLGPMVVGLVAVVQAGCFILYSQGSAPSGGAVPMTCSSGSSGNNHAIAAAGRNRKPALKSATR